MFSLEINNLSIHTKIQGTILDICKFLQIKIPHFCFHSSLKIEGNCRMCFVEINQSIKPIVACSTPITYNMKSIYTNSAMIQKARESVLEFLLLNHPLDCPICDQASECDLQDQSFKFGSDQSRFLKFKRSVEDLDIGPFIKTIMTRCIHCTRCVRFANEFLNSDNFGIIGRSKYTEINLYKSSIINSKLSGNLVDLCPVGALTSKPSSFQIKSWEMSLNESFSIFDNIGSNFSIEYLKNPNKIIRFLPKKNNKINQEFIDNDLRFIYDSFQYQRIKYPVLKNNINNQFININWYKALKLLSFNFILKDPSKIKFIIGSFMDLKSLYYLKFLFNKIGTNDISFYSSNIYINNIKKSFSNNFLLNLKLDELINNDIFILINVNINFYNILFDILLLNNLKKSTNLIAYIGPKIKHTYNVVHLGESNKILIDILKGQHYFCKNLKKSKNPLYIIGESFFFKDNIKFLIKNFEKLSFLKKKNFLYFHPNSSLINFFEIMNFQKKKNVIKKDLIFLFNSNLSKNEINSIKNENSFIIYQGIHFNNNIKFSNLILPSKTFIEKKGFFFNIEGNVQKLLPVFKKNFIGKNEMDIFLSLFIISFFNNNTKMKFIDNFKNIYFYFLKNKKLPLYLKIGNYQFLNIKVKKIKKIRLDFLKNFKNKELNYNSFIKNSKILMNSKKFMNFNNFI